MEDNFWFYGGIVNRQGNQYFNPFLMLGSTPQSPSLKSGALFQLEKENSRNFLSTLPRMDVAQRMGCGSSTQGKKTGTGAKNLGKNLCEPKSSILGKKPALGKDDFSWKKIKFSFSPRGSNFMALKMARSWVLFLSRVSYHNFGAKPVNYPPDLNRILKLRAGVCVPRILIATGEK